MKKLLYLFLITILVIGTIACQTKVPVTGKNISIVVTSNNLLGAYNKDSQWIDPKEAEKLVNGKEKFTFFAFSKVLGCGLNAKIKNFEDGTAMEMERDFNIAHSNDSFYKYFIDDIGISGEWNALPRLPKEQNTNIGIYKDVIKGILDEKGLMESKIHIKRTTSVDLDGDGTNEIIITATDYDLESKTSNRPIGSYSVVLLRKFVNGSVKNIVVKEQYQKERSEYEYVFDCPLILDIDGDGIMELIVESRFGAWSKIEFCKVSNSEVKIIYSTKFGA